MNVCISVRNVLYTFDIEPRTDTKTFRKPKVTQLKTHYAKCLYRQSLVNIRTAKSCSEKFIEFRKILILGRESG